jgi:hypothetical protein
MRPAALLCACLLLAAFPARAQQPQPLGRLFFTPDQREALDARRRARLPDKPAAAVVASPTTRVDGYVKRSSGKSTLWLDGYPVRDGGNPEGLRVLRGGDPSRVTVIVGEEGRRVDMRVGQTLDRGSGEVKDPLGGGRVKIERRGAGPR